jgi:hypothetical protein
MDIDIRRALSTLPNEFYLLDQALDRHGRLVPGPVCLPVCPVTTTSPQASDVVDIFDGNPFPCKWQITRLIERVQSRWNGDQ